MSRTADYYLELEDAGLLPQDDPTPEEMEMALNWIAAEMPDGFTAGLPDSLSFVRLVQPHLNSEVK